MTPSTRQRTRMLILLVVGVLMGIGAALVAGVQVAQDAVDDAAALDALAGVAESAARLHAATNQVVLVFAASPPDEDGALRLAVAEARATLKALPPAIEAIETIDPTDTVLVSAAGQYMAAVADILDSAETRPAQGSDPQSLAPLELAHRVLIDTIDGRRMIIRSALATSTAGSGVAVVMATGLVVLVLPTGAVLIFSRALRTP